MHARSPTQLVHPSPLKTNPTPCTISGLHTPYSSVGYSSVLSNHFQRYHLASAFPLSLDTSALLQIFAATATHNFFLIALYHTCIARSLINRKEAFLYTLIFELTWHRRFLPLGVSLLSSTTAVGEGEAEILRCSSGHLRTHHTKLLVLRDLLRCDGWRGPMWEDMCGLFFGSFVRLSRLSNERSWSWQLGSNIVI